MNASENRAVGIRVENSIRCGLPVRIAARIASTSSGIRSPIDPGSPRRRAGASVAASALKARTRPSPSSTTTGSGIPATATSSRATSDDALPGVRARRIAGSAMPSLSRALNNRRKRPIQPPPASPLSASGTTPPLEVETELTDSEHHQRQRKRDDVIKEPEDQQSRQQFLGIELPQRDHHGGVEHAETTGRMAGEAQHGRRDEDHGDVDELHMRLVG